MNLKEYVKTTKIPVNSFAKALGISRSAYYKYCTREKRPSFHVAMQIHKFSGAQISFEELGWTDDGEKLDDWVRTI